MKRKIPPPPGFTSELGMFRAAVAAVCRKCPDDSFQLKRKDIEAAADSSLEFAVFEDGGIGFRLHKTEPKPKIEVVNRIKGVV